MCVGVIARLTFHEAARKKILLAALLLGLVFLVIFSIGFHFILIEMERQLGENYLELNQVKNFFLLAAIYVVNFLTVVMTVLTSADTISGEIGSGTIHTLASKPVQRWEILLGKWLGFAGMITIYLLLMAGGVMSIVYLRGGYLAPHPVRALALMELNALMLLSVSILGGTYLSTLANGVMVLGLYGIAFIGGWIEQIGSFIQTASTQQTTMNIGIITSLILPSEALWKRIAHELQSPLMSAMGFSPFTPSSYPSTAMIIYSAGYLVVMLFLAIHHFQKRDL